MLLQFSVQNYKSFKEKAMLSMEASADKEHLNNVVELSKDRLLKTAIIFGANASGKSNIFKALMSAVELICKSNLLQYGEKLDHIQPFRFSDESINKPSNFEFIFYAADNKKYIYGFSCTNEMIVQEYLYKYSSAKASLIFDRDENRKDYVYKFTNSKVKNHLEPLTSKNTKNKLFISTATAWNATETREAFNFFANKISIFSGSLDALSLDCVDRFDQDSDNSLKEFTIKLLHNADLNILDYDFQSWETDNIFSTFDSSDFVSSKNSSKKFKITTHHEVVDKDYKHSIRYLDLFEESKGTIDLFYLSPILKDVFDYGKIMFFDEFGNSFHPALVDFLVKLFLNKSINKNNAQLIFTSHDLDILSLNYLRRDQFYFTDKSNITGESELFSLDEFSPRKGENIRRAYTLGRYGAVPNINEEIIEW